MEFLWIISQRIGIDASRGEDLTVDFTGTGPVNPNSLNAIRAIVHASLIYCLRCLIDEDIPLNWGVMRAVELILPHGMLNPPPCADPMRHPAVVGGYGRPVG